MKFQILKSGLFLGLLMTTVTASLGQQRAASVAGIRSLESFDVKVFIEGAYQGGTPAMASSITGQAYFPLTQPYSGAAFVGTPMYYAGNESVGGSVPAGAIDWVLVEVRANGVTRSDSVQTVAALLMDDGSIRSTDGVSLPLALVNPSDVHYVVVRHRNHMPVLSSGAVAFGTSPTPYNFTSVASQGYGANPMKDLGGVFGMYAADPNGQDGVTASDKSFWTTQNGGPDGYLSGDFDLTGSVTASDKSFWVSNNGLASPVPGN
ncbi:MAG: hypothetical protein KDD65_18080 [Bacteroidetes bacterium]|nr:hypothetical protein [Bacteroidota bacterium]